MEGKRVPRLSPSCRKMRPYGMQPERALGRLFSFHYARTKPRTNASVSAWNARNCLGELLSLAATASALLLPLLALIALININPGNTVHLVFCPANVVSPIVAFFAGAYYQSRINTQSLLPALCSIGLVGMLWWLWHTPLARGVIH